MASPTNYYNIGRTKHHIYASFTLQSVRLRCVPGTDKVLVRFRLECTDLTMHIACMFGSASPSGLQRETSSFLPRVLPGV